MTSIFDAYEIIKQVSEHRTKALYARLCAIAALQEPGGRHDLLNKRLFQRFRTQEHIWNAQADLAALDLPLVA